MKNKESRRKCETSKDEVLTVAVFTVKTFISNWTSLKSSMDALTGFTFVEARCCSRFYQNIAERWQKKKGGSVSENHLIAKNVF